MMTEPLYIDSKHHCSSNCGGIRHGRHRILVGFTTTCAISAYHPMLSVLITTEVGSNPVQGEVYVIQHMCDKVCLTCSRLVVFSGFVVDTEFVCMFNINYIYNNPFYIMSNFQA
jgi:hypothetical protein